MMYNVVQKAQSKQEKSETYFLIEQTTVCWNTCLRRVRIYTEKQKRTLALMQHRASQNLELQ